MRAIVRPMRTLILLAASTLIIAAAACRDTTAPAPPCVQKVDTMYVIFADTTGVTGEIEVYIKQPCGGTISVGR